MNIDTEESQNGWIPWFGGECPMPSFDKVQIKLRNRHGNYDVHDNQIILAGDWYWEHSSCGADIIAYRVVKSGKRL